METHAGQCLAPFAIVDRNSKEKKCFKGEKIQISANHDCSMRVPVVDTGHVRESLLTCK